MMATDPFLKCMPAVVEQLLGERNEHLSNGADIRFGAHGSLSVDVKKGTWFDHEANEGSGVLALVQRQLHCSEGEAIAWLEQHAGLPVREHQNGAHKNGHDESAPPAKAKIVATYDYRDEDDRLLFQVCRLEPKTFRQRRPLDDSSGWSWSTRGLKMIPYRLGEVMEAIARGISVFLAEGEKAVDALWKLGMPATCSPRGAGKWTDELDAHFEGADIIILPDNDDAGRKHCTLVGHHLGKIAKQVRILDLPDLPPKGDVADWIAAGGNSDLLIDLVDARARPWTPGPPESAFNAVPMFRIDDEATPPQWLVKGVVERRTFTLIYGASQAGKSFMAIDMALAIARGEDWMEHKTHAGLVLYQAPEAGRGVLRRVKAYLKHHVLKPNLPFVVFPDTINLWNEPERVEEFITECRLWAKFYGRPIEAVFIDTMAAATIGMKENDSADGSKVLHAIAKIKEQLGATVFVVHHTNAAGERERGWGGIGASADTKLLVERDEIGDRTLSFAKVREGIDGKKIPFRLARIVLGQDDDGDEMTSCVVEASLAREAAPRKAKLTDAEKLALKALQYLTTTQGRPPPADLDVARSVSVVAAAEFRARFNSTVYPDDPDGAAARKQFDRVSQSLASKRVIAMQKPYVWIVAKREEIADERQSGFADLR